MTPDEPKRYTVWASADRAEFTFALGDRVEKAGGDYSYRGVVVGVVVKLSGAVRYVVEDDRGMLFIFNGRQLTPAPECPR